MKATIKIQMDNAAFDEFPASELGRILREVAERAEDGDTERNLFDINGNKVGRFEVSE